MKPLFILLAAIVSAPALAQAPAASPAAATLQTSVDPQRLAAARVVVDAIWPIGTYARIMQRSTGAMMNMMAGNAFGLPLDEARKKDPYFDERLKLTMDTLMGEMAKIVSRFEPNIREGVAEAYAAKFNVDQLDELGRFFATPTGKAYANESMMLMTDPAIMKRMQAFIPEMMKDMPAIMEKVKAATAHLPPPPPRTTTKPAKEGAEQ
ncbi:MAG: DUF2059 domain-containing protein [Sphingomonas sanxanigenens]|uniref:DUF2059 domain-containing protein n=1 Tax=Sphingomonas sanxanigenens TaxID=397260 RepID=A0A2W5A8H5_9SPHN|nr:MAG: DUF2059 domain-containing protein [Sphingomonas sanxanigenens]